MTVHKVRNDLLLMKQLEPDATASCGPIKFDQISSYFMYLFKMFLHAWKNHNDRHQSPEQQQEGESQSAHGGVVC